jgi:hypothetical protein
LKKIKWKFDLKIPEWNNLPTLMVQWLWK